MVDKVYCLVKGDSQLCRVELVPGEHVYDLKGRIWQELGANSRIGRAQELVLWKVGLFNAQT
jgi:hypothetical protein